MSAISSSARPPQLRLRHLIELLLLVFAVAIPVGGWVYVELVMHGQVPPNLVAYSVGLLVIFIGAHIAIRHFAPYADPLILPVVALLNGLGLVMIHRIDITMIENAIAKNVAPDKMPSPVVLTQIVWVGLSLLLLILVLAFLKDHRLLLKFTYTCMVLGLVLLILPLIPGIGVSKYGARIWIDLRLFTVQPGEAAKLVLLVFFAGYLVTARAALTLAGRRFLGIDFPRARDLGPIVVAWVVGIGILVMQKDLGTSMLFFGTFVCLLYVATERRSWIVLGAFLMAIAGVVSYQLFSHVRVRINNWLDPFSDPYGPSYQLLQSIYAYAGGGVTGTGLGQGRPENIPVKYSDFIFSVFGEELGFAGIAAMLVLFAILIERGLRTALIARDAFGKLLAAGLSIIFALQLFITLGGITRLIPSTGLTTPFLSAGGSSLLANYILVALLLRISDGARRPAPAPISFADLPADPSLGFGQHPGTVKAPHATQPVAAPPSTPKVPTNLPPTPARSPRPSPEPPPETTPERNPS